MYYMLEILNKDADNFPEDIRGEYRNYYDDFSTKYGITTTQYTSILFWELQPYYLEEKPITHMSCLLYTSSLTLCTKLRGKR